MPPCPTIFHPGGKDGPTSEFRGTSSPKSFSGRLRELHTKFRHLRSSPDRIDTAAPQGAPTYFHVDRSSTILLSLFVSLAGCFVSGAGCSPEGEGPQVGSQTNWFRECDASDECGPFSCLCGVCTQTCESDAGCNDLSEARCQRASEPEAAQLCGLEAPPSGMCVPEPSAEVSIDVGTRHQTLLGFGAGIAFNDDVVAGHPLMDEILDAAFLDLGLDALRARNRYEPGNEAGLDAVSDLTASVTSRLGHPPLLLLSQWTPPAELKMNGERACAGNIETCTLARNTDGDFDYAGFAEHWRSSIEAYASRGVLFDFVGIQNHPNLTPPADSPGEGCRFLPDEGTTMMSVDGMDMAVELPGYRQAILEVESALAELPQRPALAGADGTGLASAAEFDTGLEAVSLGALSIHLYGLDLQNLDVEAFAVLRARAEDRGVPVLQAEIQASARDSALLLHHTLSLANASAYLQNDLLSTAEETSEVALLQASDSSVEANEVGDVFAHYAADTDPGWVRVEASTELPGLLVTAWLAPDETSLTVVLFNSSSDTLEPVVPVPAQLAETLTESRVTRTVLGSERRVSLGALDADGQVTMPAGALVTVALSDGGT